MAEFDDDELIQLSLLRDEETDALVSAGLLAHDARLACPLDDLVNFTHDEAILHVTPGPGYPVQTVSYNVENISLPREVVDALRRQLRNIVCLAETTNTLDNWRHRETANAFGIFEPMMVVYHLAHETMQHLDAHRARAMHTDAGPEASKPDKHLWFLSPDAKKPVKMGPMMLSSTKELAYRLLRMGPQEVAHLVPQAFRVLHIEQVLRADLAHDLDVFQGRLRQQLSKLSVSTIQGFVPHDLRRQRVADMIEHLAKTWMTFHGTQRHLVPSIVRHGFLMPGTLNPETAGDHQVRCGSTYGRGIYSSPSAEFSLSYSGQHCQRTSPGEFFGVKLMVCATVTGRPRAMYRDDEWRDNAEAYDGADCHVANNGREIIVFNPAQIIPVFVIHLDWGPENAKYFSELPKDPDEWQPGSERRSRRRVAGQREFEYAGDRQRAKQATLAKAMKHFPYGYGPYTGARFVVEEVAEASDDEEDYGDYQELRVDETASRSANADFWSWVKAAEEEEERLYDGRHEADEYLGQRHALRVPQGFGRAADAWDELRAPTEGPSEEAADEDNSFHLAALMLEEPHAADAE